MPFVMRPPLNVGRCNSSKSMLLHGLHMIGLPAYTRLGLAGLSSTSLSKGLGPCLGFTLAQLVQGQFVPGAVDKPVQRQPAFPE